MLPQTDDDEQHRRVWQGNDSAILYVPYQYTTTLPFEAVWNPVLMHSWFHRHWHLSLVVAVFYVLAVHLLQWAMQDRKPFQLRRALVVWNALLALFSLLGCIRFSEEVLFALRTVHLSTTICYSIDPTGVAAYWTAAFAFSKVVELGDTVFLVLRKRPLIFLHWYHHAAVLVYTWHAGCELTAAGRWFVWMNYTVHSVMYTYYAITAAGWRLPRKLAMAVTSLQTAQMVIGVVITSAVYQLKRSGVLCQQSTENLYLCFAIYATFALLFGKFFVDAYVRPSRIRHAKSA